MNKAIICGRWTADPVVRYSQGDNLAIAKGRIAVNRKGKDKGADFISVVAFGKIAEHIEKYYHKGMKADIVGRIQTGDYKDKDGKTIYTTEVVIEEIEFGESKNVKFEEKKEEAKEPEFMTVPDEIEAELPFN